MGVICCVEFDMQVSPFDISYCGGIRVNHDR